MNYRISEQLIPHFIRFTPMAMAALAVAALASACIPDAPALCNGAGMCPADSACWRADDADMGVCMACADMPGLCADNDGDGFTGELDCDDTDPTSHPGAVEVCDQRDNNCNGLIDDDDSTVQSQPAWAVDGDGDGHGHLSQVVHACLPPPGTVALALADDCDDSRADMYAGAPEMCDGADNDCDGDIDEGPPVWYFDADLDGYGRDDTAHTGCESPPAPADGSGQWVLFGGDCNNGDAAIFPDAPEMCDGVDNSCSGVIDDDPLDGAVYYADTDGDSFGDLTTAIHACTPPPDHVSNGTDCNDGDPWSFPGAQEQCDGLDNDCDGGIDEDPAFDTEVFYADTDADGFGDPNATVDACAVPPGYVDNADDCDPSSSAVHPGAIEVCDGLDNDCDGDSDDSDSSLDMTTATTWYGDLDGDGHGDPMALVQACVASAGHVSDPDDCDDTDPDTYPGALELCDGVRNDCTDIAWTDDNGLVTHRDLATGAPADWSTQFASGTASAPLVHTFAGGDVRVCPGTYYVNLVFTDQTSLHGLDGERDATVLSGAGIGRVIEFMMPATDGTVYDNSITHLTISDGYAENGAGIAFYGPRKSLTLVDLSVRNNYATLTGGGGLKFYNEDDLHLDDGLTIIDSDFIDNISDSIGGGIFIEGNEQADDIVLQSVHVTGNRASIGGGVAYRNSHRVADIYILSGSDVSNNIADFDGGGLYLRDANYVTISGSTVVNNEAEIGSGGGVYAHGVRHAVLLDSVISSNYAGGTGGGLYASYAAITCQGQIGTSQRHGIFANSNDSNLGRDVFLQAMHSAYGLFVNTCDFHDEDTAADGELYLAGTDTTYSFGDDASFTCTDTGCL